VQALRGNGPTHSIDELFVEGIRLRARVGTTSLERERRPRCSVDVRVRMDCRRAAISDDLGDTLDYTSILRDVTEISTRHDHHLLESLAGAIADRVTGYPRVRGVTVTVRKHRSSAKAFGVTIHRVPTTRRKRT